jgi:site-specific DNA-methyltransferase (adenine-specific)
MELNHIYNVDCLDGIREVADNSVSLICCDPPYFQGMTHNGKKAVFNDLAICKPFFVDLFKEFKRVLKPDGEVFFFCDWRGYAFYYPIMDSILGCNNLIVWDKISGAGNKYTYCHELIMWRSMNSACCRGGQNVWRMKGFSSGAKKTNGEKVHPTQKPIEVFERIVCDGSKPGDTVLDCFIGSGTTPVACIRNDRNFIGFELDENYFKIANQRIKEAKDAKL